MSDEARAGLRREAGDSVDAQLHEDRAAQHAAKTAALFLLESSPAPATAEMLRAGALRITDTLKDPDVTALDAASHRLDLVGRMGLDCTALALDAANSIGAANSLEKMLAHQLAVAHKTALEIIDKAAFIQDPLSKARMMNLGVRFMETFQRGLLTFQRLRTGGDQRILVQHLTVSDGGQAIVGDVKVGGSGK